MTEPSGARELFPSSRAPRSSTVTMVPRTLISPATYDGALGTRVARRTGRISRTASRSIPYRRSPSRKSTRRRTGTSSVGTVEAKVVERVGGLQRLAGHRIERLAEVGGKRRPQLDHFSRLRVRKDQPRGVQEVTLWRKCDESPSASTAVRVVP